MFRTPAGRSWSLLAALTALAVGGPFFGCDPKTNDPTQPDEEQDLVHELLAQAGTGVVLPALREFRDRAADLEAATKAWRDQGTEEAHAAARDAWIEAMRAWQVAEVMQIGPAASTLTGTPGAADLRDRIYAWPTINRCKVDQATAKEAWKADDYLDTVGLDASGLAALEAVLFAEPDDNGCPPHVEPNKSGTWDNLGADGVNAARAGHAAVLAAGVLATADALLDAWLPEGGDFAGKLAAPGEGDSPYASAADALDAVYRALFYVELRLKDRKLAQPLGLRNCPTDTCPEDAESVLSGTSHLWIRANLDGFRVLFTGGDGAGLDDLLEERGHGDVATELLAALDAADGAAEALDVPFHVAVTTDAVAAQGLYDAVKGVTDIVKGDLATVLLLTIPSEAAGDND